MHRVPQAGGGVSSGFHVNHELPTHLIRLAEFASREMAPAGYYQ